MRTITLLTCFKLFGAATLAAQSVVGVQALAFGALLAGVPSSVAPTDPANSGRFDLTGKNKEAISITFTLPSVMTGPGGATMPLSFSGATAGFSPTQSTTDERLFDPSKTQPETLGKKVGSVFLGGAVMPATGQRAGTYSATVTLLVVFM
ncbi:MAG TPA: hypothetical protein VN848_04865 [Gemmatimonadales bacterium]|nr:hypothetical protein [Gemmatimonadales bacterium]